MLLASTAVDVSPLYDLLNGTVSLLLQGLVIFVSGWVMWVFHKYAAPYVGAQLESKASADLNLALQNGVRAAMARLEGAEDLHRNVEVKGAVTGWAAQYAIDHAPDAVRRFGLDPDQLAIKALAYLPAPPVAGDLTGATVRTVPVETHDLPPLKG